MNAIGFFTAMIGFAATIFLAIKCAEIHYKTYKGEQPLYIIYALIFTILYATIVGIFIDGCCA